MKDRKPWISKLSILLIGIRPLSQTNYVNGINFTSPSIKSLENEKISVFISRKENVDLDSLDEITNRKVDSYNETRNAFSLITEPVSLNNAADKSSMMLYSYEDDMLGTIQVVEKNIIHGKWIYSLQYKADETMFPEYSRILGLMLESFKIIDFLPFEIEALVSKLSILLIGIRVQKKMVFDFRHPKNQIRTLWITF